MSNRISEALHPLVHEDDSGHRDIDRAESLVTFGAAIAGGMLARKLLHSGWKTAWGKDPPLNPASRDVDWKDALLWGAVSGALVGMMRIMSRRSASSAYHRFWS